MSVKVHLIPNIIKNILSNGSTNCKIVLFDPSGCDGDLALAIALVSRWVCAAMACAKCAG